MLKRSVTSSYFLFFVAISFFNITLSHGEEYSATYSGGNFKIFNLNVAGIHVEAVFSVSIGNEGEILFSLKQVNAPSGMKESSYGEDNVITIPTVNLGKEKTYCLKLQYKPEISTVMTVFVLSDWFVNEQSVFGVAFNATDGFGNWKENLQETSEFSKIAMIMSNGNNPTEIAIADSKKIDRATELGMKPLVVLSSIFFNENYSLYEDYEERFQTYIKKIKNKNVIWGTYLIDEYDWIAIQHGYSPKKMRTMVNKAIALVKNVLPTVLTIGVAATVADDLKKETLLGFPISADWYAEYGFPNFDLIGFDLYWTQFPLCGYADNSLDNFFKTWEKYAENLKDFLHPGQKTVLIPGTYETADSPISVEEHLRLFSFYKNKQLTDPRVGAVICFLWPSTSGMIGLRDLSTKKKEIWENF